MQIVHSDLRKSDAQKLLPVISTVNVFAMILYRSLLLVEGGRILRNLTLNPNPNL